MLNSSTRVLSDFKSLTNALSVPSDYLLGIDRKTSKAFMQIIAKANKNGSMDYGKALEMMVAENQAMLDIEPEAGWEENFLISLTSNEPNKKINLDETAKV